MRLLWIKTDFLHPTTRGGQIRTLEMVKRLHRRHHVEYIAFADPTHPEGPQRASEYSAAHYAIPHTVPNKRSLAFAGQLVQGLVDPLPVAVLRYRSALMRQRIDELTAREKYDAVVCDFLFPALNCSDLSSCVLFQHNVEAQIWRRHTEHAPTAVHRMYFAAQAQRMAAYEGKVCREVRRVIAVSKDDARAMEAEYGVAKVGDVPTGVDVDFFTPPEVALAKSDLVFLGSMDWMPNIDGAQFFCSQVLPRIHQRRPKCTVALVGRNPSSAVRALGKDPRVTVTGTVDDVRPWLHGASISIVPLRIGGGTRLKIFESMAAGVAVVSTTIGAEGLEVTDGDTIRLADSPDDFARACIELLEQAGERERIARAGRELVASRYSWEVATDIMERWLRT
jgi:glycosyltransferase involved in cell wall biosynthesis